MRAQPACSQCQAAPSAQVNSPACFTSLVVYKTAALNMNVADVGAVLKMAQDEVERMGKERAEDSRQARLIAATVEPPGE